MQTLHPRFGPWILGRQKTQNANFASKVWALVLGRQRTQNANFASKVWALDFREAQDQESNFASKAWALDFWAGRRQRIQTLHPRFGPWILGRPKTQNANVASKVWT